MRTLALVLLLATPARAEIASLADCETRIAAAPTAAREEAARWVALGGGTPARLCEAMALDALGATRTAAVKLTQLGQDTRAAMEPAERAAILANAGHLWLSLGAAALARDTLRTARSLDPGTTLEPLAEAELALGDWGAAAEVLTALIERAPSETLYRLRALTFRQQGRLDAAGADLARAGDGPDARLERAALLAAQGNRTAAAEILLALIRAQPGIAPDIVLDARAALDALTRPADAATPSAPPPLRPRPRP